MNNRSKFINEILSVVDTITVENGFVHPAENILAEAIDNEREIVIDWLNNLVLKENNCSLIVSILRLLGRLEVGSWGIDLMAKALRHHDVEVRDAAIGALESWGNHSAIQLLKDHHDSVPWLQEYVKQIISAPL